MIHRRSFLRHASRAAGVAALAPVIAADRALAEATGRLAAGATAGCHGARDPDGADFARRLSAEYLLGPDVTYLNHASIGTIPRVVHESHKAYLSLCETNPWLYMWGDAWEEPREAVRARAAATLGCESSEVALIHNTTEGFNTLAAGLPLGEGDEVLFSSLNHPGASVAWHHHGRRLGYRARQYEFPIGRVPDLTADEVVALHVQQIRPETRVLVFPHVDNIVGLRHPMSRLTAAAHEAGVEWVAVDGAQTVGMIPLDLGSSGVDFYAASPHKWVQAPKGLGLLYIRGGQADLSALWVTWGQERWSGTVRIYEDYGTRNLPALLALGDALDFQAAIGEAARSARYRALRRHLHEAVAASPRLNWSSPRDWNLGASLVGLSFDDLPSPEFAERLYRDGGFVFRPFRIGAFNAVRISPNLTSTPDDLDAFIRAADAALS